MQRNSELQELYAFNRWANSRMRAAVAKLPEAQLTRDMKNSFPSVQDTVLHIMTSEWIWLARWLGSSPSAMPSEWRDYTLEQISREWEAIETGQGNFLAGLGAGELDRIVEYRNLKGELHRNPLWQLMRHMVNHSTYHRGQVTTMLRQLGHDAVSTDLVLYYREQQAASPPTQ